MTTVRRRGRPPGRPAGTTPVTDRARLLEAAERLIRSLGPGVSMEAIAVEADVTKPILYQHVGNKDALVEALAERHMQRINSSIQTAIAGTTDQRQRIRCFVDAFFRIVDDDRNMYLFLTAGGASETWPQRAMLFADQSARPLATVLARQRVAQGADPAVATAWAYGVVGMLHYITLWWLREPLLTLDEIIDHATELLWAGLSGNRPEAAAATPPDPTVATPRRRTRS